ncbi:hypothetical protein [Streptomyces sp. NPDC059010]|uniref:hypothetical protein n=1 Tax=Streptomyces sp. NPDC059010 TaxID=3346695 RepID=UPI00368FEB9B
MQHPLDVLHDQEERGDLGAEDQGRHGESAQAASVAQQGGHQHRVGDAAFGHGQGGQEHDADCERADGLGRDPAVLA